MEINKKYIEAHREEIKKYMLENRKNILDGVYISTVDGKIADNQTVLSWEITGRNDEFEQVVPAYSDGYYDILHDYLNANGNFSRETADFFSQKYLNENVKKYFWESVKTLDESDDMYANELFLIIHDLFFFIPGLREKLYNDALKYFYSQKRVNEMIDNVFDNIGTKTKNKYAYEVFVFGDGFNDATTEKIKKQDGFYCYPEGTVEAKNQSEAEIKVLRAVNDLIHKHHPNYLIESGRYEFNGKICLDIFRENYVFKSNKCIIHGCKVYGLYAEIIADNIIKDDFSENEIGTKRKKEGT